jgi:hypothetical protein
LVADFHGRHFFAGEAPESGLRPRARAQRPYRAFPGFCPVGTPRIALRQRRAATCFERICYRVEIPRRRPLHDIPARTP